ncbi:MAG: RsmE family RNA methyltransferase, partial [Gemmatimonadota bacterium]|nr:RsmE family RNA methyltransferase [Gemmatimonadota bacterium]
MTLATFVATGPFAPGHQVTLGEAEAHHIKVRRLEVGARVALVDGQGARASGVLVRVAKRNACVEVQEADAETPPPAVHLLVPIADKERMLLVAEKAAELGATSWRPVMFRRSRSVAGRGEGPMFVRKVHGRMTAALEQSGNAWLPMVYPDANVERAIAAAPDGLRVV